MKRMIRAAAASEFTNKKLVQMLNERGIDTTKNKYELKFTWYDRFGTKGVSKKFTCPGDYLAYTSLFLHGQPTAEAIERGWGEEEFVEEILDEVPDLAAMKEYAEKEWGWQEEISFSYLKNLTTGEILFEGEGDDIIEDDDWED